MISFSIGAIFVIFDGVETGTWAVDNDDDTPNEGFLHVQTTGGAITVRLESSFGPLPGGNQTFPADALGAAATYRCSPETLEVTTTQEGHTITARFIRTDEPVEPRPGPGMEPGTEPGVDPGTVPGGEPSADA